MATPHFLDGRRPLSTAALIKELREQTGAPMMECKKALTAEGVNGDIKLAQDWLRQHGSAKASSKVAGRDALEGLVGMRISDDGLSASLAKVASETDFASRSEVFSGLVEDVADAALSSQKLQSMSLGSVTDLEVEEFLGTATDADGKQLSEKLKDAILSIRENIQVANVTVMKASSGDSVLAGYVHGRAPNSTCAGSTAALVELVEEKSGKSTLEQRREAAKKLAMHVVAAKPLYLNPSTVPAEIVEKEKAILFSKMADSGKPPELLEKIINGQLRKFYEGICLTEQPHMVEEGNPKVSKTLSLLGLVANNFQLVGMQKA